MPRVTITIPDKNAQPYGFPLDREVVTLGRGSENDIAIDSGSVSTNHAEMRRTKGGYELADVGSTNGIKLNGELLPVIPLHSGRTVHIGDVAFDFVLSDEELETIAKEILPTLPKGNPEPETPPRSAKSPPPPAPSYSQVMPRESSIGSTLIFMLLAAAAFSVGLYFRHQKETGGDLIQAIKLRAEAKPTPPKPALGQ
jgi:pSer/pThr/pTyr-binding forkhead associated (FHA) protein